jgi:hypothetical protein
MGRPRAYSFAKRRCKRDPECLSIDGHYGRCILPTERTRTEMAKIKKKSRQLDLLGGD